MKKILIAIDYNPLAEKVAEAGYAIAKAMQAEITLVHVITEPAYYALGYSPIMGYQGGYTTGAIAVVEDIKKEARNYLNAVARHLGETNISTVVLEGQTDDTILQYGDTWNADLIVIGSHRHKGLDKLLLPDVAVHILKHSKIPLFIIPTLDK